MEAQADPVTRHRGEDGYARQWAKGRPRAVEVGRALWGSAQDSGSSGWSCTPGSCQWGIFIWPWLLFVAWVLDLWYQGYHQLWKTWGLSPLATVVNVSAQPAPKKKRKKKKFMYLKKKIQCEWIQNPVVCLRSLCAVGRKKNERIWYNKYYTDPAANAERGTVTDFQGHWPMTHAVNVISLFVIQSKLH